MLADGRDSGFAIRSLTHESFVLAEEEQMAHLQPFFPKSHGRQRVGAF
jgi:hypothetical protein